MKKDSIGNRMKENYEKRYRIYLRKIINRKILGWLILIRVIAILVTIGICIPPLGLIIFSCFFVAVLIACFDCYGYVCNLSNRWYLRTLGYRAYPYINYILYIHTGG